MNRRLAVALLIAMPLVAPASADSRQEVLAQAVEAARRGDFAEAFCVWKPMAVAGDAEAQYQLGWLYANGEGLAVNEAEAVKWWQQAALQGHEDARFKLALAYLYGEGIDKDPEKALAWFRRLAETGNEDARTVLRGLAAEGDAAAVALVGELLQGDWKTLGNVRQITVDRANVRGGPTKQAKVVTVLHKGRPVVELQRQGKWVQVGITGTDIIAWLHESLLELE